MTKYEECWLIQQRSECDDDGIVSVFYQNSLLVGRGVVLPNHNSGEKHDDDDSKEIVLTGHEPITTQVTSEMITDYGGGGGDTHASRANHNS